MNSLNTVVSESGGVPRRVERLAFAGAVGSATGELVVARARLPHGAPRLPRVLEVSALDYSVAPDAVHRQLDPLDVASPAPGPAGNLGDRGSGSALASEEIRNARRNHEGIHPHQGARRLLFACRAPPVVVDHRQLAEHTTV